jgi:hypothetical protein
MEGGGTGDPGAAIRYFKGGKMRLPAALNVRLPGGAAPSTLEGSDGCRAAPLPGP